MDLSKVDGDSATVEEFAAYFISTIALASDQEIEEMAARIGDVIRRNLGIDKVMILTSGSFGSAGEIPGTREVLKLTTDVREVYSATRLIGLELPNVVEFYAAGVIQGVRVEHAHGGKKPVGVIVQSLVDVVGLGSREADNVLNQVTSSVKWEHRVSIDKLEKLSEKEATKRLDAASSALSTELSEMPAPYSEIGEGLRRLRELGVLAVDAHAGNVGLDQSDGRYKIFDVGMSSVRQRSEAPMLKGPRR